MKVYLSWSGELGRRASGALRTALQELVPTLEVWSPGSDITAGARWVDEIHHAIEQSEIALVCVTKESLDSPWLLYELGFMAGRGTASTVIPWLVDIQHSDPAARLHSFKPSGLTHSRSIDLWS